MQLQSALVFLIMLTIPVPLCIRSQNRGSSGEVQTRFGLEEPIRHSFPITSPVVRVLRADSHVRECVAREPQVKHIAPWFKASAIDLNADGRLDLVVQLSDSAPLCLMGANIGPFWVLQRLGHGYRKILRTHMLGISILRMKSQGFRDIEASQATAVDILTTIYRFNGTTYQPHGSKRRPL